MRHVKISREGNILINELECLNSSWGLQKWGGVGRKITVLGKDPKEIKQTTFNRAQFSFVAEIMNTKIIIKCPKDLYGSW